MEAHDQSCSIASGPELRGTRLRDSKQVRRLKISQGVFCEIFNLTEVFEDWFRPDHKPRRGLSEDGGVRALPDTGLTAAAGQRGLAAGLA